VDSATGIATAISATLDTGETAQHALHDPDVDIVYLAAFGATAGKTFKYFPLADYLAPFYVPASGQQAHRVGIGDPVASATAEFVLLDSQNGPYHRDPATGVWSLRNTGLPTGTGWVWAGLEVDPWTPDRWILSGSALLVSGGGSMQVIGGAYAGRLDGTSPFWVTEDAGLTWAPITVTAHSTANSNAYQSIAWSDTTPNAWTAVGHVPVDGTPSHIIRGTASGGAGTAFAEDIIAFLASPGVAGETLFATDSLGGRERVIRYATSGAANARPAGSALGDTGDITRYPGADRRLLAIVGSTLHYSGDYRAAQPATTGISATSAAVSGTRVFVGTSSGVSEVTGLGGTPAASEIYPRGFDITQLQSRGDVLAGRINAAGSPNVVVSLDGGTTWTELSGPAATVGLLTRLALIVRGGTP
jgi:hypothetical protein